VVLLVLARCLRQGLAEGPLAGGTMEQEQTNLAAAILRCVGSGLVQEQSEEGEHLTNEEAINLADWLRSGSSINAWRSISLTPAPTAVESTAKACSSSRGTTS
jgi:hypothetical protein